MLQETGSIDAGEVFDWCSLRRESSGPQCATSPSHLTLTHHNVPAHPHTSPLHTQCHQQLYLDCLNVRVGRHRSTSGSDARRSSNGMLCHLCVFVSASFRLGCGVDSYHPSDVSVYSALCLPHFVWAATLFSCSDQRAVLKLRESLSQIQFLCQRCNQ